MPNLVHGQDPGGALRPIQVDDNGNLSVDLVSGITVSTTVSSITNTITAQQLSGSSFSSAVQGIARQTNPTAVADGLVVNASFDDLGRQLVIPFQVRDLVATAYASTSTLAEVTLLAASAGVLHDLLSITASNETAATVVLSIRPVTGGNVVATLRIPADEMETVNLPIPYPQADSGNNWTIQNAGTGDISGTIVNVAAIFIKNV